MNEKKILLIAFKYPPYSGVGGFRWSKLSKYLAEEGCVLHVVTVNWKKYGNNTLLEDIHHPNIIVHRIPSLYFHNFKYRPFNSNLTGKIMRVLRYLFFRAINLFWYEDEAHFWGYTLLPFCKKLIIRENITNVIATGHPFMANYWASRLKIIMPEINLIQDFRDEWNDDPNRSFIWSFYKKKSLQHEIFSVNRCDVLIAVTDGLLKLLEARKHECSEMAVIPNGFDFEISNKPPIKRHFNFIYAGKLWAGRAEPFDSFMSVVEKLRPEIPELRIDVYGSIPDDLRSKYDLLLKDGTLSILSPVSHEKIQEIMYESFVCLLFNARIYPWARSTKIYEHASLKRPTFCINYGGEIDKLIKTHDLGVAINGEKPEEIEEEILNLYKIWKQDPGYEISPRNIEQFHYRNLAKEYKNYLK